MNTYRHLVVGLALVAIAALSQASCNDDETTTSPAGGSGGEAGEGGVPVGGGAGDGGGGGLVDTGEDLCPGDPFTLSPGDSLSMQGDTSMAMDDYDPVCSAPSDGDLVYAFTFTAPGTVSFSVVGDAGSDLNPAIYLRTTCDMDNTTVFCRDNNPTQRSYLIGVEAATYYLFVDSTPGNVGSFHLSVNFETGDCGDGALNAGEECDDGGLDTGDGCDNTCALEAGVFESCNDFEVLPEIVPGVTTFFQGSNLGNVNDHTFDATACAIVDSGGGPDRVYEITPQADGMMRLRLGFTPDGTQAECEVNPDGPRCFDRVMYVRHETGMSGAVVCANAANQMACDNVGDPPGFVQDVTFPVTGGDQYYVFIDSEWDGGGMINYASGPYTLIVDLN